MSHADSYQAAVESFARAAAALPVGTVAVMGGLAVTTRGVERFTADIDALANAELLTIDLALEHFGEFGFVPRAPGAVKLARERHVLLLRHEPSGTAIDLSFAFLPFELEALESATPVQFGSCALQVLRADDLIIQKAIAWRPIDRQDIESLLVLWGERIDLARVRSWVRQFVELLDEPERVEELELLIRKAARPIPPGGSERD